MVNSSHQSKASPNTPVVPAFGELATQFELRAHICFRGWLASLVREDINELLGADKRGFHWVRLCEKFGSPSVTHQMEGRARDAINIHRSTEVQRHGCEPDEGFDPVALAVDERVLQIAVDLRSLCIVYSGPSEIHNDRGAWASPCLVHRTEDDGPQCHVGSVWAATQLKDGPVP
jgi:hypothetical protein